MVRSYTVFFSCNIVPIFETTTALTLVQGVVLRFVIGPFFFPLLIQRCAALLRVREKKQAPLIPPGFYKPMTGLPSSRDQQSLASTFSTMSPNQPAAVQWQAGTSTQVLRLTWLQIPVLFLIYPARSTLFLRPLLSVMLPITATGTANLSDSSLNNVLILLKFIKNLISIR